MIEGDDTLRVTWGSGMDSETEALTKLREMVRRGPQRSERLEATVPQIKMIVSDWYTDELGNQARIIQARD